VLLVPLLLLQLWCLVLQLVSLELLQQQARLLWLQQLLLR
jgi:hypothetical protein